MEEYISLVNFLQSHVRINNKRISKEAIAERLNLSRQHFSALLNGKEEIKDFHLDHLKAEFSKELEGVVPASREEEVVLAATVKMLFNEIAKIKSRVFNQRHEDAIQELELNTTSIIQDMLKAKAKAKK